MKTTMKEVNSSNIESIGYDEEKHLLLVKFKSGKVFGYDYVTKHEHEALINAESVGTHFFKFIRGTKKVKEMPELSINKDDVIATLTDRLESLTSHILMIEKLASSGEVDEEILAIAKAALETDEAKSNI